MIEALTGLAEATSGASTSGIGASGLGMSNLNDLSTRAADRAGEAERSESFGDMVTNAIDTLNTTQNRADMYSQQAATGELESVTDLMVASTEAQLMTQLATQIRNRALEAFNDIMRMPV
jgi:flagellar hook-basal body complex protein FliE